MEKQKSPWYVRAVKLTYKCVLYGSAVCGLAALTTLVLLIQEKISLEQIGNFASEVREIAVYIAGIGSGGVLGIFARFGYPAWSTYRQIRAQLLSAERERRDEERLEAIAVRLFAAKAKNA